MAQHSKLFSPSASGRWLECIGSARLIAESGIKSETSKAAERGTLQHDYAEKLFNMEISDGVKPKDLDDQEWDHVKIAVRLVEDYIANLDDENMKVWTEQQVGLPAPYDDCFGTADIVGYSPKLKMLFTLDYKFGYGAVVAVGNPQLKTYALAAYHQFIEGDWEIEEVEMGIVQPKLNEFDIDLANLDITDLLWWRDEVLYPRMDIIMADSDRTLKVGSWCEKNFCPLKGQCKAQVAKNTAVMDEFMDELETPTELVKAEKSLDRDELISDEQLGELCDKIDDYKKFLASVESVIMMRLKEGRTIRTSSGPLKLVRKKTNRKWANEEEVAKYLKGKIPAAELYEKKLITITKAERALREKLKSSTQISNRFNALITKPEGELTFAEASDNRAAVVWEEPALNTEFDETDDIQL